MVGRAAKKNAARKWHICFGRATQQKKLSATLEDACSSSDRSIEYHSLGKSLVELIWPLAVKYDAVKKFVAKHTSAEEFTVHAQIPPLCESPPVQAVAGSANGTDDASRQGAESSVQTVTGLTAKCTVDALATTTPVPARCMALALKLACTVNASDGEVCNPTFTVDWKKKLGNGTFGEVFEGLQRGTGAPVAVKTFQNDPSGKSFAMKEV